MPALLLIAIAIVALLALAGLAVRAGKAAVHFWWHRGVPRTRCPCHRPVASMLRGGHG